MTETLIAILIVLGLGLVITIAAYNEISFWVCLNKQEKDELVYVYDWKNADYELPKMTIKFIDQFPFDNESDEVWVKCVGGDTIYIMSGMLINGTWVIKDPFYEKTPNLKIKEWIYKI